MAEEYGKRLNNMSMGAAKSREQVLPHLQQALAMLDQPQFYSGKGANAILNFRQLQAGMAQLFPNAGFDKYAARPNEVFTKGIAQAILDNMQTALGGLGQVRVKEIELLEKAMASPHNTVEGNRILLNMAIRTIERLNGYTSMAQDYAAGNAVTNPFSPEHEVLVPPTPNGQPRNTIDAKFDKLADQLSKAYPPFSKEEIEAQKGVFENEKQTQKGGKGNPLPTIKSKDEYDNLQAGTPFIWSDGKQYTKPRQ